MIHGFFASRNPCPSKIDHYRWVKGHKHSEYIVNFLFLRVLYRFIDFCLGSFLLLHFLASDTPSLKCRIINTSLVAIKVRSISVFYPIVPQIKDSFGLYTPTLQRILVTFLYRISPCHELCSMDRALSIMDRLFLILIQNLFPKIRIFFPKSLFQ